MKRIIALLLIICFTIPLTAQEVKEEKPENYFNDLIKTLNKDQQVTPAKKEEKKPDIPKPTTILGVKEELKKEETNNPPKPEAKPVIPVKTSAPTPLPTPTITPASVASPKVTIAKPLPEKENKTKKNKQGKKADKVKESTNDNDSIVEKKKRLFKPYIEVPNPKTRNQKIYVKRLEKKPKSRMRLITLDGADIIHSRVNRPVRNILESTANLGLRSEYPSSLSIIPINNINLDVKTSVKPLVFWNNYLTTGELLTPELEDSMLADLGENGLEIPIDINIPTLIGFKLNLLGGSVYGNAGLFVQERMRIPNEFWGLIFDGSTVAEPFSMTEEMGVNVNTYSKLSAGYGSYFELPAFMGELRFGASINAYAGAFSSVNISELSLEPGTESTQLRGKAQVLSFMDTLTAIVPGGGIDFQYSMTDLDEFHNTFLPPTLGFDLGIAWRFKLNRLIPIFPGIFKNYIDVQASLQDIGASVTMNNAYINEFSFEAEAGDLLEMFNSDDPMDLESLVILEENTILEDSSVTRPLGMKFHVAAQYQPISLIMLKGSYSEYLTEGINSNTGQNYSYGAEIFLGKAISLNGMVFQKGQYRYSEAGLRLQSLGSEFGLTVRLYDKDFSFTENISGAGLKLYWARFF